MAQRGLERAASDIGTRRAKIDLQINELERRRREAENNMDRVIEDLERRAAQLKIEKERVLRQITDSIRRLENQQHNLGG